MPTNKTLFESTYSSLYQFLATIQLTFGVSRKDNYALSNDATAYELMEESIVKDEIRDKVRETSAPVNQTFFEAFYHSLCQWVAWTQHLFASSDKNGNESENFLNYDNPTAKRLVRNIRSYVLLMHTTKQEINISPSENGKGRVIVLGPHRTGLMETFVLASALNLQKGPGGRGRIRVVSTVAFNSIPGAEWFMNLFEVIPMNILNKNDSDEVRLEKKEKNLKSLQAAKLAVEQGDYVIFYSQGGFSRPGQLPPIVQDGAAKTALDADVPLEVIRLDGDFKSLQPRLFSRSIINHPTYRAVGTFFFPNNVKIHRCTTIDFHMNKDCPLDYKEKLERMNATQYAYFSETSSMEQEDIDQITRKISSMEKTSMEKMCNAPHIAFFRDAKAMSDEMKNAEKNEVENIDEVKEKLYKRYEQRKAAWRNLKMTNDEVSTFSSYASGSYSPGRGT